MCFVPSTNPTIDEPIVSQPEFFQDEADSLISQVRISETTDSATPSFISSLTIATIISAEATANKHRAQQEEAAVNSQTKTDPDAPRKWDQPPPTEASVDANLGGSVYALSSFTGAAIMVCGTCVISVAKKQVTKMGNSTEAEIEAAYYITKLLLWVRQLMEDLGIPYSDPIPVAEDNLATRTIALYKHVTYMMGLRFIDALHRAAVVKRKRAKIAKDAAT
jgi:hypothetical protein